VFRLLFMAPVLMLLIGCASVTVSGGDSVLIERTEVGYTVYAFLTKDMLGKIKAELSNAAKGIDLIAWETFVEKGDKYIKSQIVKDEYPESGKVAGIVELLRKFPGTPIGLTWNGGIAITRIDYEHAKRTYEQYKTDPVSYERNRNRDPRADPVNPKGHLGPLLGR
jgi:hypothetical protein